MKTETEAVFWVVWNPEGRNPQVRHTTQEKATHEAKRLAIAHPGERFVVLESVDCYEVCNLTRTVFEHPIPF